MKTFLNVLYRRILYKIPLKFLLVLLWIWALIIASANAEYTKMECQTEYNLIPSEEIDNNYCEYNNLCQLWTWETQWSALIIDTIQHDSASTINIDIAEELERDYTRDEENDTFNLVISGYNVDNEYIEKIIQQEKLTPTNEDVTKYIQWLSEFIPYIFIALLLLFTIKIINRVRK